MTMTFSLYDSIDSDGMLDRSDFSGFSAMASGDTLNDGMHILRDKLQMPDGHGLVERPRLNSLLTKSAKQFPATLISGRAGTGKTVLAANFAASFKNACWYSIESTDIAWRVFSRYFSASLPGMPIDSSSDDPNGKQIDQAEIAGFLVKNLPRLQGNSGQRSLIVLDDIHHIFDAPWFDEFFNLLLCSLPAETHLLLLCRSKPPSPLWRLRSKQILNVIDEKVIAFNMTETEALFDSICLTRLRAKEAHGKSFGRISKLLQFVEERGAMLTA